MRVYDQHLVPGSPIATHVRGVTAEARQRFIAYLVRELEGYLDSEALDRPAGLQRIKRLRHTEKRRGERNGCHECCSLQVPARRTLPSHYGNVLAGAHPGEWVLVIHYPDLATMEKAFAAAMQNPEFAKRFLDPDPPAELTGRSILTLMDV